jgi:hypothetical protein
LSPRTLTAAVLVAGGLLLSPAAAPAGAASPTAPADAEARANSPKPAPSHYVGMTCQEAEARAKGDGYSNVRVVKPGQMVTQEYMPDRLNLHCDAGGNVAEAKTG